MRALARSLFPWAIRSNSHPLRDLIKFCIQHVNGTLSTSIGFSYRARRFHRMDRLCGVIYAGPGILWKGIFSHAGHGITYPFGNLIITTFLLASHKSLDPPSNFSRIRVLKIMGDLLDDNGLIRSGSWMLRDFSPVYTVISS